MRTLTCLLGVLALVFTLAAGSARAQTFLSAIDDLPLAPGLSEVEGSGLSFDAPGGRLVEAYARGAVKAADIIAFYAATLPQLGWSPVTARTYRRDAERLSIETQSDGRFLVVHFTIAPE